MRLLIMVGLVLLFACKNEMPKDAIQEIRPVEGGNADLIRNPVSMDKIDTSRLAKIVFTETIYDFGTAKEGTIVPHRFVFKNTGNVPLLIEDARSTCGCTVPQAPNFPIPPGDTSSLYVTFNTTNKENYQIKHITVLANTYPSETSVAIQGTVLTKKAKQ